MEEIVSLIVANGLWAVLFCALLYYQLRDGRARELKYTQTIRALSERLNIVTEVKADTDDIKADTGALLADTEKIKSDTDKLKRSAAKSGGGLCAKATT